MIGKKERQQDIIKLITDLDITPTMYKNAVEKYKALASYLEKHTDFQTNMYPQGSFALGTVVRPIKEGKDADYDLDFICEVNRERGNISASELRNMIENALSEGDIYAEKLIVSDECFTIQYADEGGAGFSIDIVPAVHENEDTIHRLKMKSDRADLIDTSIAIPMYDEGRYEWKTNNPKGLYEWFSEINKPYLDYSRASFRALLFENSNMYEKIEEIPNELERSAVQRAIQILKRNRDLYYFKFPEMKPISAIINVIVAEVAASLNPNTDVFTLLDYVLDEITESSKYYDNRAKGEFLLENRIVGRRNIKWYIANPANPEDNLASAWNENSDIPKLFFKWIRAAKHDLIDSMEADDEEFRSISESAFGTEAIKNSWAGKYNARVAVPINNTVQPWRMTTNGS